MLEVSNLEVVYHSVVRVIHGLSLTVADGSIVALLGPNGAGKTTTLRAITALLAIHDAKVTRGEITWHGEDLTRLSSPEIVNLGMAQVMEGRRIFQDLTVEENLLAGAHSRKDRESLKADLAGFLDRFPVLGRRKNQQAGYLSGGEQQMLAIARALMSKPKLLLLDEPSLGLAPKIVGEVAELIKTINAQGVAILLVEQNAALALDLADHGYLMENGRVVLDGSAEDLRNDKDVREFYLGMGSGGRKNYREIKHYRRRKRWLS